MSKTFLLPLVRAVAQWSVLPTPGADEDLDVGCVHLMEPLQCCGGQSWAADPAPTPAEDLTRSGSFPLSVVTGAHRRGRQHPPDHLRTGARHPCHDDWPSPGDSGTTNKVTGWALPGESTIRRVNADDLDARLSSWLRTRVGVIGGRRVIAVDGRTMRGARGTDDRAPHLLAASGRAGGVVVGQQRVADESNEIPTLPELLAPLDSGGALAGVDVTAHPEERRRLDHLPRRPLRAYGQGHAGRA